MAASPAIQHPGAVGRFAPDQVELIKRTICKGATDDELQMFLYQANRTGLDPIARQIYSIERREKRDNNWVSVRSIQVSIDGLRLVAERSGKYAGQTEPQWCGPDGVWRDVWLAVEPPSAARIGVLRSDFQQPCWGVARLDAYVQRRGDQPTYMWQKMPDVMLAKCAESLALRKAFPQELSGLYTSEEMAQADEAPQVEERISEPQSAPQLSPKVKPLPAPKKPPTTFGDLYDPQTGEIEGVRPQVIQWDGNAIAWGSRFVAEITGTRNRATAEAWVEANKATLEGIEEENPKVFARIAAQITAMREKLEWPLPADFMPANAK